MPTCDSGRTRVYERIKWNSPGVLGEGGEEKRRKGLIEHSITTMQPHTHTYTHMPHTQTNMHIVVPCLNSRASSVRPYSPISWDIVRQRLVNRNRCTREIMQNCQGEQVWKPWLRSHLTTITVSAHVNLPGISQIPDRA